MIAALHPVVYDAVRRVVERERESSEEGVAVTLCWDDPESASEFTRIREALRGGWTWDADRQQLLELVRDSKISNEEGSADG